MKYIRFAWHLFNLIVATSTVVIAAYFFDMLDLREEKKILGKLPKLWAKWMMWALGVRYNVFDFNKYDPKKKYVFVANHKSALDPPLVFAAVPFDVSGMGKEKLFDVPVFGKGLEKTGMIPINREGNAGQVDSSIKMLARTSQSLCVFPEGKWHDEGELGEFRTGAFVIAAKANWPVVPVAVIGSEKVLPKKSLFPNNKQKIAIIIGDPIKIEEDNPIFYGENPLAEFEEIIAKKVEFLKSESRKFIKEQIELIDPKA